MNNVHKQLCDYEGCQKRAHPALNVYGCAYCEDHYLYGLEQAFLKELSLLKNREPSIKFRNLFGRYVASLYSARGTSMPEELAGSKLRDRAEQIQCRGNTIIFIIERHPMPIAVRQRWKFSVENGTLSLIDEEPTYLDCEGAAERLGVTPATVRRYIRQGKLTAQKASEIKAIDDWFDDKMSRGNIDLYIHRNRVISADKWLIPIEEFHRFEDRY